MDGQCAYDKSKGVVSASAWRAVEPTSDGLKAAISLIPVAVSV
jgi:hypothetical protein